MSFPVPPQEGERLKALQRYKVLDTPPEEAFDRITKLAALVMDVPIALVSLVDRDRQWFKSKHGLNVSETSRDLAFCAHAICGDSPLVISDASADLRFSSNPLVTDDPKIQFYAGAPLRTRDGHNLGTLCVIDRKPRELPEAHQRLLIQLASMVIDEFEIRLAGQSAVKELSEQEDRARELQRLAMTDPLTGAFNRRAFSEAAEKEWLRAKRYKFPLSLLAIDVDHFKRINDRFGHPAGDSVLKALVGHIQSSLRSQDVVGRMGGEEFAILAPHTDASNARIFADRLKERLEGVSVETGTNSIDFTVSIGVTECIPDRETVDEALARADTALYAAKQGGRNRVECQAAA